MYEINDIFSSYWEHQMWQTGLGQSPIQNPELLGSYFILSHHTCQAPKSVLVFSCRGHGLIRRLPIGLVPYISARILFWTKIFFYNLMTRARNRVSPEIYTFLKNKEYKQSSLFYLEGELSPSLYKIWKDHLWARKRLVLSCCLTMRAVLKGKIASIVCHKSRTMLLKSKIPNCDLVIFLFQWRSSA